MRLPNSIPKVLQAQNNKLPSQPRGRGIGRGCNAALQQNPSRPGINNAPNSLDERQVNLVMYDESYALSGDGDAHKVLLCCSSHYCMLCFN